MNILLDTHALIWWVSGSRKLTREQGRVIEQAKFNSLFLSEMSFWEIAMLVEANTLTLREPFEDWLERASAAPAIQCIGITPTIAREMASLSTTRNWDPADRIIVATARVWGARLVTSDSRIIDSGLVQTV
jgi:PIN domain nuclease of toxin-antitoxin system